MQRSPVKKLGRRLLLALTPLLVILEIPGAVELWNRPDTGMVVRDTEVVSVHTGGPADAASLAAGDRILEINGRSTPDGPALRAASYGLRAGQEIVVLVQRDGDTHGTRLNLISRTTSRRLRDYLATSIGFLFLFLGFITYLRRGDLMGRVFYTICVLFALLLLDLPSFPSRTAMLVDEVARNAVVVLLPAFFLRFFLIFPEGGRAESHRRRRWLLAPPILLTFFNLWVSLRGLPNDSMEATIWTWATLAVLGVYMVAAIIVFARRISREDRWVLWTKLRLALFGMTVGVLPFLLAAMARQIWPANPAPLEEASLLLLPLVPISFSVALLRTGTIDFAYLSRQAIIGLTLALPIFGLSVGALLVVAPRVEGAGRGMVYLMAVLIIFGLSLIAVPARRAIAGWVDRLLYPDQVAIRESARSLSAEMNSAREPADLARFLCERVGRLLHARSMSLYMVENESLVHVFSSGDPQLPTPPAELARASSVLRATLRRREPLLVEAELTGPRPVPLDLESQRLVGITDATILAPLWGRDAALALLIVGPPERGEMYGEVALHHFRLLCAQAGSRFENAMLHREDLARERIAAEMDLAREIQARLLPHEDLETQEFTLSGKMVPCREVGGDVFDYFTLPDGRVLFVVADASGKGVPASLLMSSLRAALRETVAPGMRAADVALRLNERVCEMTADENFIACFLGILDPSNGVLGYCTAGIDPPLWWRQDKTRVESLTRGGPVLGVVREPHYREAWIRLRKGDVVAAYSDGIVDEEREDEEPFGLERLLKELRGRVKEEAESIRDGVLSTVTSFSVGESTDDKTLLILKFRG